MKWIIFLALSITTINVCWAGGSGYISNGELVYIYKEGKKIADFPTEKKGRAPASYKKNIGIYFFEDDHGRCYYSSVNQNTRDANGLSWIDEKSHLSCIQLK